MNWSDAIDGITTIILDIDGVMTDGHLYYTPDFTMKAFNAQDGHAIKMAMRVGLKVGIISGREDPINIRRIRELGMSFAYTGAKRKIEALERLLEEQDVTAEECLFVGDDVIDMPIMHAVGIGVAVKNAVDEVKEHADVILTRCGGGGAVREIICRVMKAQGTWAQAMARYLPPPEEDADKPTLET